MESLTLLQFPRSHSELANQFFFNMNKLHKQMRFQTKIKWRIRFYQLIDILIRKRNKLKQITGVKINTNKKNFICSKWPIEMMSNSTIDDDQAYEEYKNTNVFIMFRSLINTLTRFVFDVNIENIFNKPLNWTIHASKLGMNLVNIFGTNEYFIISIDFIFGVEQNEPKKGFYSRQSIYWT